MCKNFVDLILPEATNIFPPTFNKEEIENYPVVVVNVKGSDKIGNIFGKTKITGGTRLGSWDADNMDIIYCPDTQNMRCWWTMR